MFHRGDDRGHQKYAKVLRLVTPSKFKQRLAASVPVFGCVWSLVSYQVRVTSTCSPSLTLPSRFMLLTNIVLVRILSSSDLTVTQYAQMKKPVSEVISILMHRMVTCGIDGPGL